MGNLWQTSIILMFCIWYAKASKGDFSERLTHYETLHTSDLKHNVVKRSVDELKIEKTEVEFKTLGKHFRLMLHPRRGALTSDFKVTSVRGKVEKKVDIDMNIFFEGYLQGEKKTSKVIVHYEGDMIFARIQTKDDIYVVEPSWRHLPKSDTYNMISYKASDLKNSYEKDLGRSFCGYVHPDRDDAAYGSTVIVGNKTKDTNKDVKDHHREKRQSSDKTACTIFLAADYKFYANIGAGSVQTTVAYMVDLLTGVNMIYKDTDFDGYTNLEFEIRQIQVYEEYTSGTHYNMQKADSDWSTADLLDAFSKDSNLPDFCIGHLFTHTAFTENVLGLAWISPPEKNGLGGICSPASGGFSYNSAWSSTLNSYGSRILTQEAEIVMAHELGHNMGSQHDPESRECAPSGSDGGKFIMYTYSVSGFDNNNRIFSPCSTRNIGAVLDAKQSSCFTAKSDSFCGNSKVEEPYEECDAGYGGEQGNDPCCTSDCKLKTGAVCSDANSVCCSSCQYAQASVICERGLGGNTTCKGDAYCTGNTDQCGDPSSKANGTPCIDDGTCDEGVCLAFCESKGLISCICEEDANACYVCCKSSSDATCTTFGSDTASVALPLSDGKPCYQGFCETGVCIKQEEDLTGRLFSIIDNISVDYVKELLKNNIVLAIVIVSILIYVPICLCIYCVDKRNDKKDEEERKWMNKQNDKLVLNDGKYNVSKADPSYSRL